MVHSAVFNYFKECLPDIVKKVETYFPNGRNSIRVRQRNGQEFIYFRSTDQKNGNLRPSINFLPT